MRKKIPPKSALLENLGKPGAAESLQKSVQEMLSSTQLGSLKKNVEENFDNVVAKSYGMANLLKNYKKAPVDKNGKYDVVEFINNERAKNKNKPKQEKSIKANQSMQHI